MGVLYEWVREAKRNKKRARQQMMAWLGSEGKKEPLDPELKIFRNCKGKFPLSRYQMIQKGHHVP